VAVTDRDWLRKRVARIVPFADTRSIDDVALRDLGVQSVDLILLLAEIEQRLGAPLADEDLDDRNFVDVASIERLLGRLRSRDG
jgi:acyl carrier protein